ncbi:glycosyltransferase [Fusibacter sp. Q10-2]|uniref:Glycosyltransferase n=2 Tax=Fusibacter ferrireducens TaxID=2785058 RepID=A0ABR9ZX35_9FIRM|nr:glycosyltransferase [Fusibacter ferrireducens]
MQFVSAVIYLRNNASTLKTFLTFIDQTMCRFFSKYEIICVNDASVDETLEIIKNFKCQSDETTLTVLNMSYFQGLELSMTAGVDLAIGDFVYEFDTVSLDYDECVIQEIYQHALTGFDIVNAAADSKPKLTSYLFYSVFNKFANLQYTLGSESFRILSRRAINRIRGLSESSPYRKALYANCGLKMDTHKYQPTTPNSAPASTGTVKARTQLATDALILFTDIGYKFASTMTVIMMLITVLVALYAVVVYIFQNPVEGWTPTILFLSFAFFGLFAILAVVIKYLSIIVNLLYKKQKYVYESIQKYSR